ncbi:hypothetical protein KY333_05715 [Candidatus Woesearchaeota archaeon]|nr:hypothetical protein [Candidatus Woesearchaeota archaeon]MBW2994251.1 hypothetical protein [Candidatus Woesearchaeota archaeon]
MSEITKEDITARIKADTQIILQGGHYIAVDSTTLEEQTDGTYVAAGKRKFAGLFFDGTMEHVAVMYDSNGKFMDYDSLPEED